jgi:hypothetical protein
MSTIEKKSYIDGRNEDSNSVDLFKDSDTGNLMYRTSLGVKVAIATPEGIQALIDRVEVLEKIIEKIAGVPKDPKEREAFAAAEKALGEAKAL